MNRTFSMKTRAVFHATVMALGLFGLAVSGCLAAHAETLDQTVNRLLNDQQPVAAMAAIESALQAEPARVEYRFLKAVVFSEMGRSTEAVELFRQLSQDMPASPEPLNNLGVLYARQGQLEDARAALTAAVAKNPAYATAYENLGDVHARLAAQAYDRVAQLTPGNATVPPKLGLVSRIAGVPAKSAAHAAAMPGGESGTNMEKAPLEAMATAARPGDVVGSGSARPATASEPEAAAVEVAVRGWAADWSRRDTTAYLARYTSSYTPAGMSREAWEKQRRARIEGKAAIAVRVNNLHIKVRGQEATARFLQEYTADNSLNLKDQKTLHLVQEADKAWRIDRETTE